MRSDEWDTQMDENIRSINGYVLLVANTKFEFAKLEWEYGKHSHNPEMNPTRFGAPEDETNLQYVFENKLNFQLLGGKAYRDVHRDKFRAYPFWMHKGTKAPSNCKCLTCLIQTTDHSKSTCFAVVISTHGGVVNSKQQICLSDESSADRLTLAELIDALSDSKCQSLRGITRVIILTVCRAELEDPDIPAEFDPGQLLYLQNPLVKNIEAMRISEAGDEEESQSDAQLTHSSCLDEHVAPSRNEETSQMPEQQERYNVSSEQEGESVYSLAQEHASRRTNDVQDRQVEVQGLQFEAESRQVKAQVNITDTDSNMQNTSVSNSGSQSRDLPIEVGNASSNIGVLQGADGASTTLGEEDISQIYVLDEALQNLPDDFIVVFSCYLGRKSVHDNKTGSWIVEELRKVLEEHNEREINFLQVLTDVCGRIARERETKDGYKTAVTIYHRLTRPLIFKTGKHEESQQNLPNPGAIYK